LNATANVKGNLFPRLSGAEEGIGVVALEFEVLGDDEAVEFVRGRIERIEKAPASEAVEASYRFPEATPR
jgi:hypothetical protein